jgi:type VI secretion system protein ImpA
VASLDIDSLLNPISEDAPCGKNLEYDPDFIAMENEAKGTPERQVGANIEPAQPPNWKNLRKMVLDLTARTRDLRLLVELARTCLNLEGISGLKVSLALLRKSLENYWDTIHPQLDPEDNDPTNRVNILTALCDRDNFLLPLLNAPLVESRVAGRFSLRDVQLATGKTSPPKGQTAPQLALIQGAFSDVPPDSVMATLEALKDSLSDVNGIENFITQQVDVTNAASFAPIRDMLKEALHFVNEQVERLGLGKESDSGQEVEANSDSSGSNGVVGAKKPIAGQIGGINNRQDVVRALELICEYYANHEPSSPVPLLVRRAKRLVTMDFMEILQDLAPSGISQLETIKGPDSDKP